MALDGEVYEVGSGAPPPAAGHRTAAVVVSAVVAAAVLVAGVLVTRTEAPAAADGARAERSVLDRPIGIGGPAFVLDTTGLGRVRLGMTLEDYRGLYADRLDRRDAVRVVAVDVRDGCVQVQSAGVAGLSDPQVWVWARDGRVVAVGATRAPSYAPGPTRLPTAFGVDLGDPLTGVGARGGVSSGVPTWRWERGAGVATAKTVVGSVEATLADVDGDGLLDYGRVEAPEAAACDADPGDVPPESAGAPGGGPLLAAAVAAQAPVATEWRSFGRLAGGNTVLQLADGSCLTLTSRPQPVLVEHLDRWYGLGEETVTRAGPGGDCPSPPGTDAGDAGAGGDAPEDPGPAALDGSGLGPLRLGMPGDDLRALYVADSSAGRTLRLVAVDRAHDCYEYDAGDRVVDAGGARVRIWMRADAIVAVGVSLAEPPPPGPVPAFGLALGDPLDSSIARDLGWRWSHDGLVPAAWTPTDAGRAVLLDSDGDGLLDAARAEAAGAEACGPGMATSGGPAA